MRLALALLFAVGSLLGQDAALVRLARAAQSVKATAEIAPDDSVDLVAPLSCGTTRMDRIAPPEEQRAA